MTQAPNGKPKNKPAVFFNATYSENYLNCQNTSVSRKKRALSISLLTDSEDILPSLGASCQPLKLFVSHRNIWRQLNRTLSSTEADRLAEPARVTLKMTEPIKDLKNK